MALVWVLTREAAPREPTTDMGMGIPYAVYATYEEVEQRVESIRRSNPPYPLRPGGKDSDGRVRSWWIGPEDDEGFFGNRAVLLTAHEVKAPGHKLISETQE